MSTDVPQSIEELLDKTVCYSLTKRGHQIAAKFFESAFPNIEAGRAPLENYQKDPQVLVDMLDELDLLKGVFWGKEGPLFPALYRFDMPEDMPDLDDGPYGPPLKETEASGVYYLICPVDAYDKTIPEGEKIHARPMKASAAVLMPAEQQKEFFLHLFNQHNFLVEFGASPSLVTQQGQKFLGDLLPDIINIGDPKPSLEEILRTSKPDDPKPGS